MPLLYHISTAMSSKQRILLWLLSEALLDYWGAPEGAPDTKISQGAVFVNPREPLGYFILDIFQ